MLYEKTRDAHKYQFESLGDLQRWLTDTPRKWKSDSAKTYSTSNSWDLNLGWEGAVTMARTGWLEGAQRVSKALKAFKAPERAPLETLSVAGYRPCVPAHLAGSPRSMFAKGDNGAPVKPVVRLVVQVDAAGMVSAESMANIGAAIAQYIKEQEAQGVRVEVWGAMGAVGYKGHAYFSWCVKRAMQPLDLPVLAFSIGHPAMLRRIGFAMLERCDAPEMTGYGGIIEVSPKVMIKPHKNARYLNGMANADSIARTPAQAWNWVERMTREAK